MEGEFITLCMEGKLEEAKKFLEENPKIDISAENDYAYVQACANGHKKVVEWLKNLITNFKIYGKYNIE